jgi:hypothetical protein
MDGRILRGFATQNVVFSVFCWSLFLLIAHLHLISCVCNMLQYKVMFCELSK